MYNIITPNIKPDDPGVYLLYDGDEVVYVGQSIRVVKRLRCHIGHKIFDSFKFIIESDRSKRLEIELDLMSIYLPKYNEKDIEMARRKCARRETPNIHRLLKPNEYQYVSR